MPLAFLRALFARPSTTPLPIPESAPKVPAMKPQSCAHLAAYYANLYATAFTAKDEDAAYNARDMWLCHDFNAGHYIHPTQGVVRAA